MAALRRSRNEISRITPTPARAETAKAVELVAVVEIWSGGRGDGQVIRVGGVTGIGLPVGDGLGDGLGTGSGEVPAPRAAAALIRPQAQDVPVPAIGSAVVRMRSTTACAVVAV